MKRREIIILNMVATIIFIVGIFGICLILNFLYEIVDLLDPIWLILLFCYAMFKFINMEWKERKIC